MKTKYIIGLLCIIVLAGLFIVTNKAPAQGNSVRHIAVMIGDTDTWHYEGTTYVQTGREVVWVDASPGVPLVNIGTSISAAIAFYMDLGCTHEMVSTRVHLLKK